ncbi:MAG TPA: hypothetical protein VHF69_02490 [Candidatus Synoicihabitans sp.]|nr:hypothetical protein [Candidatus Synoicihabitans sp.]
MKPLLLLTGFAISTACGSVTAPTSPLAFADDPLVLPELSLREGIKQAQDLKVGRSDSSQRPTVGERRAERRQVFRMPIVPPAPNVDYKLRVLAPDASVDYKLRIIEPADDTPK